MFEVNFNVLSDRAMDVDPDIRFMVLQDFQKYLASNPPTAYNNIDNFLPVLFRLLQDHNTDVQSQAIKSFEPLVGQISPDSLLKVIKKLFGQVKTTTVDGFTTSIPNMALKSILNSPNADFELKFQRQICNELLPNLTKSISIDNLEILIDLIKNFGQVMTNKELADLSRLLINTSFSSTGITSKLAISSFESLCAYLPDINESVQLILQCDATIIKFQLYSIIFRSDLDVVVASVDVIFSQILLILNLDDDYMMEDIDFDKILQTNLQKEMALVVLIDLINSYNNIDHLQSKFFDIINQFIPYDPYASDDIDDVYSDDIEFSDIENDDDELQNDGCWKLRLKSSVLLSCFIDKFPNSAFVDFIEILPIDDSNELVNDQAIKTLIKIIQLKPQANYNNLKNKIANSLLIDTKISQLTKSLILIEKLKDDQLLGLTFQKFIDWNMQTNSSIDYLNFYKNIIKDNMNPQAVSYICRDLKLSIVDKSFNVIKESIKVLTKLVKSQNHIENIDELIDLLVAMVNNSKSYSSDLLQLCIICLSEIILKDNSKLDIILQSFKSSLAVDNGTKIIIDNLIKILPTIRLGIDYQQFLVDKLTSLILTNDETVNSLSLNLLYLILRDCQPENTKDIISNIIRILNQGKPITYEFDILNLLSNNSFNEEILYTIVKLINNSKLDETDSLFQLVRTVSSNNPQLYEKLYHQLNLKLFISAKILAIIAVENQMIDIIENCQLKLIKQLDNKASIGTMEFVYNIQFLANVSESINLTIVDSTKLLKFLNEINKLESENEANMDINKSILQENADITNEEIVKNAIAVFIGIIVKQNIDQVGQIIDNYQQSGNSKIRIYLVNSFKEIIKASDYNTSKLIWETIVSTILKLEFSHEITLELRMTGDLLSDICLDNNDFIKNLIERGNVTTQDPNSYSLAYTAIIIIKSLINKLDDEILIDQFLSWIMNYIDIVNIDIKQAIVGTLISSLHTSHIILKHLNRVLPKLFDQLIAEPSFKKTIKMGPYKYVLDNGIEIRKLIYEFFYSIDSLNEKIVTNYDIRIDEIIVNMIKKGLIDEQIDIIVLSCINLINIMNNHEEIFYSTITANNLLNQLIDNLSLQLNKKLSVKASSQDIDSYQERLSSIIKVVKKIEASYNFTEKDKLDMVDENNIVLELDNWCQFYQSLQSSHPKIFREVS